MDRKKNMKRVPDASISGDIEVERTPSSLPVPASSRGLYYAVDTNPRVLFELRRSISSVRRYASTLPIYAVIAGEPSADDRRFLDSANVTVIAGNIDGGTSPTFMKWRALAELPPQDDLLYLDTDTLVFDDPSSLFDLIGHEDFHARLEIACDSDPSSYPMLINVRLLARSNVDHDLFRSIAQHLGVRLVPIFNTGIMLFRNGLAHRLGNHWKDFVRIERQFRHKQLPYPCLAAHLLEEMVAPLVLGGVDSFTWRLLEPELCPFYAEYRGRNVKTHGTILHTWAQHYDSCVFEFIGKDDALAYQALRSNGSAISGLVTQINARKLLLGSMWMRFPKSLLERWLRNGASSFRRRQGEAKVL